DPGHGGPHARGARRPQARAGLRHRVDGRPQAGRVRPHPDVPHPRAPHRTKLEAEVAMAKMRSEVNRQATAAARYLRISSPKLNQVAALIRGTHIDEARRILAFTPKAASHEISKVLEAAIANAEHNTTFPANGRSVTKAVPNEGPTANRSGPGRPAGGTGSVR